MPAYDHTLHKEERLDPAVGGMTALELMGLQSWVDLSTGTDPLERWCESQPIPLGSCRSALVLAPATAVNPAFSYVDPADPISAILFKLVAVLDDMKIPYAFTGSFALGFWAEPRSSKDVDVVLLIDDREEKAELLRRLVSAGIGVPEAALDDLERHGVAPIVVCPEGRRIVVELIVPRAREPADRHAFTVRAVARARTIRLAGVPIQVVSAEDLAAYKLLLFRTGARPTETDDLKDVRMLLYKRLDTIDLGYIRLVLQVELPGRERAKRSKWLESTVRRWREG